MWYSLLGYQMENAFEEPSQFCANVWVLNSFGFVHQNAAERQ